MRLCSRCSFYSKPEVFSYTYIYCALYAFVIQEKRRVLCKGCEKEKARRACLLNSLCLLGLPCAVASLCKANTVQDVPPPYLELDSANTLVKRGDKEGLHIYEDILSKNNINAGVRYNLGMAYIMTRDWVHAAVALEGALADCSNYSPAAGLLLGCYKAMGGQAEKLSRLEELFGLKETENYTERDCTHLQYFTSR
jgi:hypothetical protein